MATEIEDEDEFPDARLDAIEAQVAAEKKRRVAARTPPEQAEAKEARRLANMTEAEFYAEKRKYGIG